MILLDTHVVIWAMDAPGRISKAAGKAIAEAGAQGRLPGVSTASVFELVYARRRGRVQTHVSDAVLLEKMRAWLRFFPVTDTIAFEAAALPQSFHGDPMDRIIAATAIVEGCTLLTADGRIRAAKVCKTLW